MECLPKEEGAELWNGNYGSPRWTARTWWPGQGMQLILASWDQATKLRELIWDYVRTQSMECRPCLLYTSDAADEDSSV